MTPCNFLPACALLLALPACADVIINEFHAAPNEALVDWNSSNEPRLGTGPHWQEMDFDDTLWSSGTAPLGAGTGTTTNLSALMQNKTPTLYVRKIFNLSTQQAASFGDLILTVSYDDGFVAFINGREAARANMGPARQFSYAQMTTYRADAGGTPVQYNLGPLVNWLVPGTNVLAVQVHNRDLTSNCRIDPTLASVINPVVGTLASIDFNEANGASKTHQNSSGTVSSSGAGSPPAGSWLANGANPISSPLWQDLTITTTAAATQGTGGSGAQRYDFSQAGLDQPAAVFGAPVSYVPFMSPVNLTVADLSKLTVSFRYRMSPGASFGFRVDPTPGAAAALSGFSVINESGGTGENPLFDFSTVSNGNRRRQVDAGGVLYNLTTNPVVTPTTLLTGPAMRGGSSLLTRAEFNLTEDATAGAGAGGSTGAVKFFVVRTPATWDYFGFYFSDLHVLTLPAGTLSPSQLGEAIVTFDWKLAVGETFRVYLEPESGTYADRQDFGTLTGTGNWEHYVQSLTGGSSTAAFLAAINATNTRDFRLVFRRDTAMPVQTPIWLDNVGFSNVWHSYSANLGTNSNAGTQAAFVTHMNANALTTFVPAFEKLSTAPAAPASSYLILDDFKVSFNGAPFATPQTFIAPAQSWKYFVGRCEPSGGLTDPAYFADSTYNGDFSDWIEVYNNGSAPADVSNWGLTDDADEPHKWQFPAGTTIPAFGYLVVLADAPVAPVPSATYLHANFSLTGDGEYLGLYSAGGSMVQEFDSFPKNSPFHSYGRDPAGSGNYGYLRKATPGQGNSGTMMLDYVRTPDFSIPGGHYNTSQTITLSTSTAGAEIRYTTDGSDPSSSSTLYTTPLVLNQVSNANGHCIRARAFKAGWLPSGTKTHTYLINQHANLRTAPAMIVSGDPGRSMFQPYGIMAIQGGSWSTGPWVANGPNDYNNALADINNASNTTIGLPITGGPWERPATVEFYYPDGRDGFREDVCWRVSGSAFTRPRYVLSTIQNAPWSYTSAAEKPGFNLFFDSNYGKNSIEFPFFPNNYPIKTFSEFRLRAGHNDIRDPFVKDEYMRRTSIAMGQHGSNGIICPLYVNGKFRGIFNVTERLRESFMQTHFNSSASWDVRQVTEIANGDGVAFADFTARLEAYFSDQSNQAKYDAVLDVLDVTNYIDYAIVNIWGGTGDWPHNNFVCARERSAAGKWRWFVWDAEGAFGGFSKHLGYNILTQDLLASPTTAGREICRTYSRLSPNKEFRMLFADRIHKHFCNDGALSDAKLVSRKDAVVAEYQPMFSFIGGGSVSQTWFTPWVSDTVTDKRDVLFRSAVLNQSGTVASYASASGGASTTVNIGTHVFTAGTQITISGSSQTTYNGTWTISAVGSSTVTIPVAYNATTPTTLGSWSVTGYQFGYQFPDQNLWPALNGRGTWNAPLPPQFNQHGGDVSANFSLTISHTEVDSTLNTSNPYKIAASQAPAGRVIYYSTTGEDPRLKGGGINPAALVYSAPVTLSGNIITVKSRIYNTSNLEWSPLTEAEFRVGLVSPSASNLVVAEIMYNPADATTVETGLGITDKDDFEFIRLQNIGASPEKLYEAKFTLGVTFDFSTSSLRIVAPGQSVLLVKSLAAFQARYGHDFDGMIAGEFGGNFSNSGERIRLEDSSLPTALAIRDFTYDDDLPWPDNADGTGASLLLINPNANPDHTDPQNWTSSALPGGLFPLGIQQNYERWRNLSFSPADAADNGISGMEADADHDGLNNLIEFALGAIPTAPDESPLPEGHFEEISGEYYLALEYRVPNHHSGLAIQAQVSSDMNVWTSDVTQISATANPDGSTSYIFRDNAPFSATQRRYIRLQVTLTP